MPARVEKKVASSIGTKMSVGCSAPICALYTIMLTGMSVSPLVLSTRNIIIGLDAVSFFLFKSCNCSIAFRPKGVAALSRPSILAAIFMKIEPVTGCPLGMSGNRRTNTGLSILARIFTTPPFSPIFIIPSQYACQSKRYFKCCLRRGERRVHHGGKNIEIPHEQKLNYSYNKSNDEERHPNIIQYHFNTC